MTWFDDYLTGLSAAIAAAWPDVVAGSLFLDTQAQKRDWPNLLNSQELAPPWGVVKVDPQPTGEWGTGAPRFDVGGTVYYITADNAVNGTSAQIVPFLLGKLIALQERLLYADDLPGTVLTGMTMNANSDNPVDTSFLSADQRFTAGSLEFHTIIVAVPS